MERVTKASINGISFAMTDQAFHILDSRLSELSNHYGHTQNGLTRMAEYEKALSDYLVKNGGRDNVVSAELARRAVDNAGGPKVEPATGRNNEKSGNGGCLKTGLVILLIIMALPVAAVILGLIIALVCAIAGISVGGLGGIAGGALVANTLFSNPAGVPVGVAILHVLVFWLPVIAVIYALVMVFLPKGKRMWKPIPEMAIVWLISVLLYGVMVLFPKFNGQKTIETNVSVNDRYQMGGDTLFIRLEPASRGSNDGMFVQADDDEFFLAYAPKHTGKKRVGLKDIDQAIVYPVISLERQWYYNPSDSGTVKIRRTIVSSSHESDENEFIESLKGNGSVYYRLDGDTLVLSPITVVRGGKADFVKLELEVPGRDFKVLVNEPVPHDFASDTHFQNILSRDIDLDSVGDLLDIFD